MSKPRIPDTIHHAMTLIMAELGVEPCAKVLGKSASLLYKASDPDDDFMLNLQQCFALDQAYFEATGAIPPITAFFMRSFHAPEPTAPKRSITQQILQISKELGECSAKVLLFTSATSDGGKRITHNEAVEAMKEIDDVEQAARIAKQLIMPFVNNETKGTV